MSHKEAKRSRKKHAYVKQLCKCSPMLQSSDIKFLYSHMDKRSKFFSILMPITRIEERFEVSDQLIAAKTLSFEFCGLVQYHALASQIMQNARDFRALHGDLRPLDLEENRLFDVGVMDPNPCIPYSFWTYSKPNKFELDLY